MTDLSEVRDPDDQWMEAEEIRVEQEAEDERLDLPTWMRVENRKESWSILGRVARAHRIVEIEPLPEDGL